MKLVHITNNDTDEMVLCSWENYVAEPNNKLCLKVGDDMVVFYRNNKDKYKFEGEPYYKTWYHPKEKLEHMIRKNPQVNKLIETFSLVLTV